MSFDLLLQNGTLVLPWGRCRPILACATGTLPQSVKTLARPRKFSDASHLHVLAGVYPPHVHFRDGGMGGIAGVEDMLSGTLGAVLGGVTCVFDMPNTNPAATDVENLTRKHDYIAGRAYCDVGIYVGANKEKSTSLG